MAKIVLIHGVGQEFESRDELESKWIPAISGGVRLAGNDELADSLMRGSVEVRMAFYGHLFRPTGKQGYSTDPALANDALPQALAHEWLRQAARAAHPRAKPPIERALYSLEAEHGEIQGAGRVAGAAIRALATIPWIASLGMELAERLVWNSLGQVRQYVGDEETKAGVLKIVTSLIDDETVIIIGHSLGSIIAYEACQITGHDFRLLLTLGSPLGVRTVVYDRLVPTPPTFPARVKCWHNIADVEDFVAAVSDLTPLFRQLAPHSGEFRNHIICNGANSHDSRPYLNNAIAGSAISEALS